MAVAMDAREVTKRPNRAKESEKMQTDFSGRSMVKPSPV